MAMLDPQARDFLRMLGSATRPPMSSLSPAEAREANVRLTRLCAGPTLPLARVDDRAIPGPRGPIPIRIYVPAEAPAPAPVLVYYHGGGFVIGDLTMVDEVCRMLAIRAACIVVSVDYRLAPEHRYPAPREDAYAAAQWVAREAATFGGDARRIAVGGDSAGGTLATVVALVARDSGGPALVFQLLVYPGSDRDMTRPSMIEFGRDYLLTSDTMAWFWRNHYDGPRDRADPYLAPLEADDLAGLPPALVITAGFDPLRDGGELYARRLLAAGVPTELVRYDGMIHGFFVFPSVFDKATDAVGLAAAALAQRFATVPE